MSFPILSGNVATATAATGYNVANSCRFNDDDNPSLKKTPSGAGSLTNWTFSCWVKRCESTESGSTGAHVLLSSVAAAGTGGLTDIRLEESDFSAEFPKNLSSFGDTSDLSPEFGLSYNEIYLEGLDMSHIGISDHDIQAVLEEFFAIKEFLKLPFTPEDKNIPPP